MEMRWFSTYPIRHVLCDMAIPWQMLTGWSSSKRSIWSWVRDTFWHAKAGCRPADSILRPTRFNYSHSMIIERLRTYGTALKPSQRTKITESGAIFGGFDGRSGGSVRDNFGMNGQDAALLLPSKVLKYFIDALKWKQDGSAPIQCNMCCIT